MLPLASAKQLQRITLEVFVPRAFDSVLANLELANLANSDAALHITLLASKNAPNSAFACHKANKQSTKQSPQ